MERNISPAVILCIVLVSLAAVIGLGFGVFAITKGSANDGTQEVVTQTSAASKSWKDTYDAKDVTGAQVQSLVKEAESKGIAVFINTRGMSQGTINSTAEVPVLKHNGKYYMNYGIVFDYEDDSYKKTSGEISMSNNSGLLGVRDGSSLKVDYNPKLQDGKLVRHEDYTGLYTNGAINYIDTHAKFRSNLIYGNDGEVAGVILSQVNRPGVSLPFSSGDGFVNGSAGMGGTSGSYIPSHSNSGNIPLTGWGSTGSSSSGGGSSSGGSSSSGSSSYAPSTGGANAPGTSTKPSAPAPETASGEFVITFDTRGGNVIDYQKVSSGAKVIKPDAPVRTNYGFAGWYTDESCTKKFNFSTSVSKNITLYARWFMWGDVDNNGVVNVNDENNIFDYTSMDLEYLNFYLAAFTTSPLDSGTISARDVDGITMMRNGQQPVMPVSTATSGYEFDLEKGKYYTTSGDEKSLPVAEERFRIVIGDNRYKFVVRAGATWSDVYGKAQGLWLDSGNIKSTNEGYLLLNGQIVKASDKVVKGGNYTIGQPTTSGNVIPAGATYYVGVTSDILGNYSGATQILTAGNAFPSEVKAGDVYICGDYEYRYKQVYNYSQWESSNTDGWGVRVLNDDKAAYGSILSSINGVNITSIEYTFAFCTSLKEDPVIPNKVTNMAGAFQGCTSLTTAPTIPSSVTHVDYIFYGCESLNGIIEINATNLNNISVYDNAFDGTVLPIVLTGSCNSLSELAATSRKGNVTVKGSNIIPVGAVYYTGVTANRWGSYEILDYTGGTAHTGGSQYPGEAQVGDVLVCGDYEYRFGMRYQGDLWFLDSSVDGWSVASKNWSSSELGAILIEINDYPVVSVAYAFQNTKITKSPVIPSTVVNMDGAYDYCPGLSVPPVIPNGMKSMARTFLGCEALKEPPILPNTVTDLTATFYASGIKTAPNIPNSVTSLSETFACSCIETPPVIPNSVTNMYYTFASCSDLKTPPTLPSNIQELECTFWGAGIETAPVIPASVKNMSCVFLACENLSGTVRIHANPTYYDRAFGGTVLSITLVGNSSKLAEIAATGDSGNVIVQY